MDKKYVKDYNKKVQEILLKEHGVHIDQKDIQSINTFLFKNIVYSLMRHIDVRLTGFLRFNTDAMKSIIQIENRKKKKTRENPQ